MSEQAPIEALVSVVPAPDMGADVFTNENKPWNPGKGNRAIFGGFVIAQAVRAAQLSMPSTFAVHALQSVFLKPGKATSQIYYHVERVADGRTFATRVVRAVQDGVAIYVATIGLQRQDPAESGLLLLSSSSPKSLEHGLPPPDMDGKGPDDIPDTSTQDLLFMLGFQTSPDDTTSPVMVPPDPFDWRHLIDHPATGQGQTGLPLPHSFRLRSYVRSPPLSASATGQAPHLPSLAFLTDEWLIAVAYLAYPSLLHHLTPASAIETAEQMNTVRVPWIALQASMHHGVLFHDSRARVDEWLISERKTSWAGDGRVLLEQRFWSLATGRLVLSCWQEALVRLREDARL